MKRNRFIVFGAFVLGGIALLLLAILYKEDYNLLSLLLLFLSIVTILGAMLDSHINPYLRNAFLVIGLLFLAASALGLLLTEEKMSLPIYCIVLAVLEIINGIIKCFEVYHLFKEKNYMFIAFAIDALFEIAIGTMMIFEKNETLRLHTILISIGLMCEGTAKLVNEFVEDKKGIHE